MSKNLEGAQSELQNKITERDGCSTRLRKSERENRAVINSVSDVIFETDETGKVHVPERNLEAHHRTAR